MSDVHQEWKELRQKNGDFINHLDGEMAKLEKKQVELKHHGSCSACTQQGMQSKIAKQAAEIKRLTEENKQLHNALNIAAKDADANFERGKIKGMEEIWVELKDVYAGRPIGENEKIFGYCSVGDIIMNLSPTWFMNKVMQHAKDIQIGDEVEIFDEFCPDDDPHSDIGIVIAIDKDHPRFAVIGPKFEGCFDETDIKAGNVRKTGRHFDSIPLDYLA